MSYHIQLIDKIQDKNLHQISHTSNTNRGQQLSREFTVVQWAPTQNHDVSINHHSTGKRIKKTSIVNKIIFTIKK